MFDNENISGRKRHAAIALVLLIVMVSWVGIIDRKTEEYVNESTVEALAVFGTLRLSNAVISVVRSVEVDAQLASVQMGQMLDPIHDLIEDASNVVKLALGSLITQKLLVEIVSSTFFKILLTILGVSLIASFYIKEGRYSAPLFKSLALVGLVRFLFVLVVLLNALVSQAFLEEQIDKEQQGLENSAAGLSKFSEVNNEDLSDEEIAEIQADIQELTHKRGGVEKEIRIAKEDVESAKDELEGAETELNELKSELGWKDRMFSENPEYDAQLARVEKHESHLSDQVDVLDVLTQKHESINNEIEMSNNLLSGKSTGFIATAKAKMSSIRNMMDFESIKQKTELMVDSMLRIMALFVLQTIIIPLLFLVLLLKGFRYIWGVDAREFAVNQWNSVKSELQGEDRTAIKNQEG